MIKYELKKLFTNKFVIAMFAVIFTVILAIAIYTYSEYKRYEGGTHTYEKMDRYRNSCNKG